MQNASFDTDHRAPTGPLRFAFSGPFGAVEARGPGQALPRGPIASLAARVADAGRSVIGGALPFFPEDDDYLWQAAATALPARSGAAVPAPVACREVLAEPSAQDYAASVAQALRLMDGRAALAKVVLARTLAVATDTPIAQGALFRRIALDPTVTAFRVALPGGTPDAPRALIGATPELLLSKTGGRVISHPLAGSARRQPDAAGDSAARQGLEQSDKDHREHRIVTEYILDTLAPFCTALGAPEGAQVTSTRTMWHLGTRIEGRLRDPETPSILLAAALHPTPAVCGMPPRPAARLIRELEPVARRFYAGAVGWTDMARRGDGAWFVAIRCADICGCRARLYAGAGIVPGSDPAAETAETGAKFGAMLSVLGLPADAGLTDAALTATDRKG